jgi:hypothetical protein
MVLKIISEIEVSNQRMTGINQSFFPKLSLKNCKPCYFSNFQMFNTSQKVTYNNELRLESSFDFINKDIKTISNKYHNIEEKIIDYIHNGNGNSRYYF